MPVKADDIVEFCSQFRRSDWRECHVKIGDFEIFASKDADADGLFDTADESAPHAAASQESASQQDREPITVRAPVFGTFHMSQSPEGRAVEIGDHIRAGDVIAAIEVLGERSDVQNAQGGVITEIHAAPGELVDFDAKLFSLEPVV